MFSEYEIKKQICEIGKRIYNNGFVAANDGNISVKINEKEVLCTPTGVSKGYMTPDMICKVNLKGEILQANSTYKPSSEIKMHLRVYKERNDVKSVVHAHPPYGTSYAIAGIPLNKAIMPEAVIFLGEVPIVEYGTPSTEEIPNAVSKYLNSYDAVLLENHGALTYGVDLMAAYFKMESLEFYAKLMHISSQIGEPQMLNDTQIEKLLNIRKSMNLVGKHPGICCNNSSCKFNSNNSEIINDVEEKEIKENEIEKIVKAVTAKVLGELNR
ncbi:MAG: class II aldolase/adducin family protein [Sarcina sp.]